MKLFVAIIIGVVSSFGLTILIEMAIFSDWMPRIVRSLYVEFPAIALFIGILLGLIAPERHKMAAALSLAPWAIWLTLGANREHSTVVRWAITVALLSTCIALGIGTAACTRAAVKGLTAARPERS